MQDVGRCRAGMCSLCPERKRIGLSVFILLFALFGAYALLFLHKRFCLFMKNKDISCKNHIQHFKLHSPPLQLEHSKHSCLNEIKSRIMGVHAKHKDWFVQTMLADNWLHPAKCLLCFCPLRTKTRTCSLLLI